MDSQSKPLGEKSFQEIYDETVRPDYSRLERFKMDFKERFLNFETAKGIYLIPAGFITCIVSIWYQQYVIQTVGTLFGWYMVSEGLRKLLVNRYKQARKQATIVAEREELDSHNPQ